MRATADNNFRLLYASSVKLICVEHNPIVPVVRPCCYSLLRGTGQNGSYLTHVFFPCRKCGELQTLKSPRHRVPSAYTCSMKSFSQGAEHPAHAVQAWQILVGKAMNRQTVTYEGLSELMYKKQAAGVLAGILG